MDITYYKKYEPIFGTWTLVREIGEGSYGKVFEIEREDFGRTYRAALKAVTIPQSRSEVSSARAEGMDDESVTAYFRGVVEELVDEFALMSRLKGNSNVVSYEDHTVVRHRDDIGWDILIRMELLTPLLNYTAAHPFARKDVMKLGMDMCRALELCQKFNIVHRDIKPENIFVSELGDFKLGDFGIARTVEKTTGGLSKKGTYTYMAPEIYRGEAYGSGVDVYSLGVVLYRMLNENRAPFLPAYPAPITHGDREAALAKRLSGAPLPPPKNADGRLAEIVLKACAYDPKERFSSPMQMRQELEAILYNREEAPYIYPAGDDTPVKSVEYVSTGGRAAAASPAPPEPEATENLFDTAPDEHAIDKTESLFGESPAEMTNDKTKSNFDEPADGGPGASGEPSGRPHAAEVEAAGAQSVTVAGLSKGICWPLILSVLALYAYEYLIFSTPFMLFAEGYVMAGCVGMGVLIALYVHICVSQSGMTKLTVLGMTLLCSAILFVLELTVVGFPFMLYLLFTVYFLFSWLVASVVTRRLGDTGRAYIWSEAFALLLPLSYVLLISLS